jgi:hypothetical protein
MSLFDLTTTDLGTLSEAGLLEKMEWHVPAKGAQNLSSSPIRLRLDSRLYLYSIEIEDGNEIYKISEVYAAKGEYGILNRLRGTFFFVDIHGVHDKLT